MSSITGGVQLRQPPPRRQAFLTLERIEQITCYLKTGALPAYEGSARMQYQRRQNFIRQASIFFIAPDGPWKERLCTLLGRIKERSKVDSSYPSRRARKGSCVLPCCAEHILSGCKHRGCQGGR